MIDPIRFRRFLTILLKVLVILELVTAFAQGARGAGWDRFGLDLVIAGALYIGWERISAGLSERKQEFLRRAEATPQQLSLRDALIFSLLSSDEIFGGIPEDRKRIVVISYTLIALGVMAGYLKFGTGLMPLVVSGALVLAAVNLVVWVVSQERGERETLQTELKLARDVQMSLMPREQPALTCYDIAGMSQPAQEVGGDFYNYTPLGNSPGPLGIAVLDVSGKGLQAAMSAVFASGAYASEARVSTSPAEILTRLNRVVYKNSKRGHFIAFVLAALDPATGRLVFANAGQTRPLHFSGGTIQSLDSVGVHFPLGMQEETIYEEREIVLQPGDSLVMLTDGFTDAMNIGQEQYGIERVERLLAGPLVAGATSEQTIQVMLRDVTQYAGAAPQHDDMTAVVLKRACA